jgi:hypothetical protein
MVDIATLTIRTVTDSVRTAARDLLNLEQQAKRTETSTTTLGRSWASTALQIAGVSTATIGITGALVTLGAVYRRSVSEAAEFERQHATLMAVLRATGTASGHTAEQIEQLASSIGRATLATTDEATEAATQLLTFRSIAGETFDRTLRLSQDLAAVGFGSISSAAVQLGKALEDPVQGLSALRRVGVSFSEAQRELISSLVDTGQTLEAQRVILDAVEQQVGGAGEAQASGLSGAIHRLSENWEDLLQNIGDSGPWQAAIGFLNDMTESFNERLNPTLEQARARLERLKAEIPTSTVGRIAFSIAGDPGNIQGRVAAQQELVRTMTAETRAREVQAQFAAESGVRTQAEIQAENELAKTRERQGELLGDLAKALEKEDAAAKQTATTRAKAIADITIEAEQQQRLSEAKLQGEAAVRAVSTAIDVEQALRRANVTAASAEGQALTKAITLQHQAADATEDHTAAAKAQGEALGDLAQQIERESRANRERFEQMLRGPTGEASFVTGGPGRRPATVSFEEQQRNLDKIAQQQQGAFEVSSRAALGHFETVDAAGIAAGESMSKLTSDVLLYGKSWEEVGRDIIGSLIQIGIQIAETTVIVAGLRAVMGVPGGFGGALQSVLGIPAAGMPVAAAGAGAGMIAPGGAGGGILAGAGVGSVTALPAGGGQSGLVGTMFGEQASTQMASQASGTGAAGAGSMGMIGMFLGAGVAGALGGALLASATGGSAGGGAAGGAIGGIAGFALGGPVGALIGASAGGFIGGQLFGQSGFDVRVPGAGGGDTVPFFAMVQPGERVTATPPGHSGATNIHFSYAPSMDLRGATPEAVTTAIHHERQARLDFERRIVDRFQRDPKYRKLARVG